jgi:integrase
MVRSGDFTGGRLDRALGMIVDAGNGPRTVNVYRSHALSFGEWPVKIARILERNPATATERRRLSVDVRKLRRSLTGDEARLLLDVSVSRRLYYSVSLLSGLRVAEVQALEWRDLILDGDRPCIRLRAEMTKVKRADELPLHPDLVEALSEAKPPFAKPKDRVFCTVPTLRTFKRDPARAGIPFKDDRGRTVDRHALRTTVISWLGLYGVDPRAQLILARHAPQGVTLKHY